MTSMENYPAAKMIRLRKVAVCDMCQAFLELRNILGAAEKPMCAWGDMNDSPVMPIMRTVASALSVYDHPKL
jgi:hypothetical protein